MNVRYAIKAGVSRKAFFLAVAFGWIAASLCSAAPDYPWNLKGRSVPAYKVLDTDNPDKDEYSVTYALIVCVDARLTRDDIKTVSEKLIEGLPLHNMALIFFVANPAEKDKGWTVARTWWGQSDDSMNHDDFRKAGDYSKHIMKIAMKGQELPGDTVEKY